MASMQQPSAQMGSLFGGAMPMQMQ
jgi:hypothetical protein